MALNYPHWPVFPAHISEDNLWSPMRIVNGYLAEGVPERNRECSARPWDVNREEFEEWGFDTGRDEVDQCRSPELNSKDLVDLLPSDPFGMDLESTFTAITGWLEDLEADYGGCLRSNNGRAIHENYGLFAEWKLIWNNALTFQPFPGSDLFNQIGIQSLSNPQVDKKPQMGSCSHSFTSSIQCGEKLNVASKVNSCGEERDVGGALAPYDFGFQTACDNRELMGFSKESTSCSSELQFGEKVDGVTEFEEMPSEVWLSVISCLGVKDLLSVERVCKSLCSKVRNEPWLWRSIHIDLPLNERITDDSLLQLASRAEGKLQCLNLVECPKVTDDGIRRILEANPQITKLFVPGCTRLTIEGILNNIKIHNSNKGVPGIKHLRIGGIYGVTREHFEELKLLLGPDGLKPESCRQKPHFYHRGNFYLPFDDDRVIDIEMCPGCEKFRLVYDCPAKGCQVKGTASQVCRACKLCIARCAQCGRCISDNEYEETFCLDLLCSDCYKPMLKCEDRLDKKVDTCGALHEPSNR